VAETTVQIEDVESRFVPISRGREAGTTKPVFNIKASDGRYYGTFDEDLGKQAGLLRGQTVNIEYSVRESTKGDKTYTNYDLKGLSASDVASVSTNTSSSPQAVSAAPVAAQTYPSTSKDLQIARAVALKAAVETFATGALEISTGPEILQVADSFTDWLLNGPQQETANPTAFTPEETAGSDPGDTAEPVDAETGQLVKF
jgi:hypothetical protein